VSRDAALDAGCDDCLSKPFEIDDLMESIRQSAQH
jgi:DNA-binding response OmpR family regulator